MRTATFTFTFRASAADRQLITALAQRLERNESDTLRQLVRKEARALGLIPAKHDDHAPAKAVGVLASPRP